MKTTFSFLSFILIITTSCNQKGNSAQNNSTSKPTSFINQLFLFQENGEPHTLISGESVFSGALYITSKGNVIYTTVNEKTDTQRFYYGTYQLTDTSLTYHLTNEFYYHGKWDAKWDVASPDYLKGQTKKVKSVKACLLRTKSDSLNYFKPYTEAVSYTHLTLPTKRIV